VNLSTLLKVYYAMAYSHLQYSIINWGASCATNINAAIISQKKLIRILTRSSYNAHTNGLFRQLKLLKLSDIYRLEIRKTMYKLKSSNHDMLHLFTPILNIHSHWTISSSKENYFISRCNTELRKKP